MFGGPHTFTVAWTSSQFRDKNPALYKALIAAFAEATEMLDRDVKDAAQYWIDNVKSKMTVEKVAEIAAGKQVKWTMVPENTMKYAEFMHSVGSIKVKPATLEGLVLSRDPRLARELRQRCQLPAEPRMDAKPAKCADAGRAPLLQVSGVTLQYKTEQHLVTATYRVSFDVYRADRFVVLGPSGCGKSTLLKAVGGYMAPTEGSMRLKGVPIRGPGADRMFVFQEFDQLLPWKTVKQNVMFALQASGKMRGKAAEAQAMRYIDKVNLAKFANSYPHTLSGGMKQRVAIARAHGHGARHPADGRAVRRARRPDPAQDAGRAAAAVGRHALHRAVRHALDPRGRADRQPHPADVAAPGPGQGRAQQRRRAIPSMPPARKLSDRIHDMLFADRIEEQEAVPHG